MWKLISKNKFESSLNYKFINRTYNRLKREKENYWLYLGYEGPFRNNEFNFIK